MQRELGRLTHGPHKEQQGNGDERAPAEPSRAHLLEHPHVVQSAEGDEDEHHAQAEAEVAHPVDDKRLLAGSGRRRLVVEEADEVVGAEPHRFPAEVQ